MGRHSNLRVRAVRLPEGAKDVNEFVLAGGDLWAWLKGELGSEL